MGTSFREINWQITILILSVIALILLGISTLFEINESIKSLFLLFDTLICLFLMADVFYWGAIKKSGRKEYWKWGWLDLISSIPVLVFLRWGRIFRVFKIILLMRNFKSTKDVFGHIFKDPASGTLFTVSMAAITLLIFGSIGILHFELGADGSTINNPQDAFWWSFFTIASGRYSDFHPVTNGGIAVSAVLRILGAGIFGTLTAFLAKYWVRGSTERDMWEIKESLSRIEGRVRLRKRRK